MQRFPFIYSNQCLNHASVVDPLTVTDDWKYVEYEDLKLLNRGLSTGGWNYQEDKNPGIDLDVDPFIYDEKGGVIKLGDLEVSGGSEIDQSGGGIGGM